MGMNQFALADTSQHPCHATYPFATAPTVHNSELIVLALPHRLPVFSQHRFAFGVQRVLGRWHPRATRLHSGCRFLIPDQHRA